MQILLLASHSPTSFKSTALDNRGSAHRCATLASRKTKLKLRSFSITAARHLKQPGNREVLEGKWKIYCPKNPINSTSMLRGPKLRKQTPATWHTEEAGQLSDIILKNASQYFKREISSSSKSRHKLLLRIPRHYTKAAY